MTNSLVPKGLSRRQIRSCLLFMFVFLPLRVTSFTPSTASFMRIHSKSRLFAQQRPDKKKPKLSRFTQSAHQEASKESKDATSFDKQRRTREAPLDSTKEQQAAGHVRGKNNNNQVTSRMSQSPQAVSQPLSNSPPTYIQRDKMWRRNQSVEDLEEALLKRWGDDDDDSPSGRDTIPMKNAFAKPVLDPWAKKRETLQKTNSSARKDNENHGSYEPIFGRSSNKPPPAQQRSPLSVDHLIARTPAGGKGTFQINDKEDGDDAFFFQAPKAKQQHAEDTIGNAKPKTPTHSANEKPRASLLRNSLDAKRSTSIIKQPSKSSIKSLVDENGNIMYLTTQQAMRNFEANQAQGSQQFTDNGIAMTEQDSTWQQIGIKSPQLLQNLYGMSCIKPLSVQCKSIPAILDVNTDVVVGMYTGSGKTLAFLTPIIGRLLTGTTNENEDDSSNDVKSNELKAIIVAPGRELASQIVAVARDLVQGTTLSVLMAIGGTTSARTVEQLRKRKPSMLVGTPGRLAELIVGRPGEKGGRLKLAGVQTVVLDEFDALLEYDAHAEPTNALMQALKRRHGGSLQTILCSATACDMVESPKLQQFLRPNYYTANADQNDALVTADGAGKTRVSKTVIHGVVHVQHRRLALDALRRILHTDPVPQQILVFVENSRKVEVMVEKLKLMNIIAAPLHGGRGSEKMDRAEVSKALREGYVGLVVATELAARGLDAPLLTHVLNYDLPTDASHYAHRAGRCGRGGRPGVVINMTTGLKERNVPRRLADELGVEMHHVEIASSKLYIVNPSTPFPDARIDSNS
ncbi:hypothetical protein MPSEU_000818500 [Mayamaea pseudoterrestris]|nr:hypothetical protein MPSEU_000818500 [Mayamaea pseudoterrestris]